MREAFFRLFFSSPLLQLKQQLHSQDEPPKLLPMTLQKKGKKMIKHICTAKTTPNKTKQNKTKQNNQNNQNNQNKTKQTNKQTNNKNKKHDKRKPNQTKPNQTKPNKTKNKTKPKYKNQPGIYLDTLVRHLHRSKRSVHQFRSSLKLAGRAVARVVGQAQDDEISISMHIIFVSGTCSELFQRSRFFFVSFQHSGQPFHDRISSQNARRRAAVERFFRVVGRFSARKRGKKTRRRQQ